MGQHYDRLLTEIGQNHAPFIVYDLETTGRMNGHDNRITQIALTAYLWNLASDRYELRDHMFILAKPDPDNLRSLIKRAEPTRENAREELRSEFMFKYGRAEKEAYEKCKEQHAKYKALIEDYRNGTYTGRFSLDLLKKRSHEYAARAPYLKKLWDEKTAKLANNDPSMQAECNKYIADHLDEKIDAMKKTPSLKEELALQGITLDTYIAGNLGLTGSEMQTGIMEFLSKYDSPDTIFITNGTYYQKHYLAKAGMGITKDWDHIVDYAHILKENIKDPSKIRLSSFVEEYQKKTGKQIKTFDSFTKALCFAEMAASTCGVKISNRSLEQLTNAVKTEAFKNDENYVMSLSAMANHNWISIDKAISATYTFSSLEFVQFGNDRRYVDLDKMFEVNDNFEITLEGEKEPIKTWDELEAKIKALNSHISNDLLEKIKTKYEELEVEVNLKKQNASAHIKEHDADNEDVEVRKEREKIRDNLDAKDNVRQDSPEVDKVKDLEKRAAAVTGQLSDNAHKAAAKIVKQMLNIEQYLAPEASALNDLEKKYKISPGRSDDVRICGYLIDGGKFAILGAWSQRSDKSLEKGTEQIEDTLLKRGFNPFKPLFDPSYIDSVKRDMSGLACSLLEKYIDDQTKTLNSIPADLDITDFGDHSGL